MTELSTAELALLHLDGVPERDATAADYDRSVPGIVRALDVGDTVAGRVELLTSLREVADDGLVRTERGPVAGLSGDRSTYWLTATGRRTVAACKAEIEDDEVVVERPDERTTVAVEKLEDVVPELSLVQALARMTDDGVLRLHDGDGTSFVDRADALETFEDCLDDVEANRSRTVLISGEHGMGKTALVETVFERARDRGFRAYTGAAREAMSEPYAAFRAALQAHRADAPPQLFEESEPERDANLDERRRSFFYEVAGFLRELSEDAPLAVFLNDLERADPATIALLGYLHSTLSNERVLLVGAVTPEAMPEDHQLTADDRAPLADATRIDLEGFDRTATVSFLEQLLDDTGIPAEFVDAVQELTGGNPLFLQASVTYMVEDGTIDPRTSYYPTDTTDLPVPDRIQSVILERIDGLDPGTENVLQYGSVVGETVWPAVLHAVVDVDDDVVEARTDRLVDAGVWSRDEDDRLRFTSNVVREVVHESLSDEQRSRRHEEVAAALQEVYADERETHAAEVANQYRAAGVVDRAIDWYQRAGDHAAGVYAYETAVEAYEQALELAREVDDDDLVLDLVAAIGRVHMRSDDYDEAQRYFEYVTERTADTETLRSIAADRAKMQVDRGKYEATVETVDAALAEWDGDARSAKICKLLVRKGRALSAMGEREKGNELGERAEAIAEALNADDLRAIVLKARGVMAHHAGEFERSTELGNRGAEAATAVGAERLLAGIYNNLAGSRGLMGDFEGALEAFERSRDRWQAIGNRVGEAVPVGNIGYIQMRMGEFDAARANIERSAELGERFGMPGHLAYQWLYLGVLSLLEGDVATARDYVERGLEKSEAINQEGSITSAHANLSRICRLEDDHEAALEHIEYVVEETEAVQNEEISKAQFYYGQILCEQGDVEEAMRVHREALEEMDSVAHWKPPVMHRIGLAVASAEAGRVEEGVELATAAAERAAETGNVPVSMGARTALGRVKLAAGEPAAAESVLREVVADAADVGSLTYECQARIVLASALRERGADEEARTVLEKTIEDGRESGAALFVRAAEEQRTELA